MKNMKKISVVAKTVRTNGKSMKVLQTQLNQVSTDIQEELNYSSESIGSDIKVLNGSFSTLKPMYPENDTPGTSFQPGITSTPKYEDISEPEDESEAGDENELEGGSELEGGIEEMEQEDDLDMTFEEETFIAREKESCDLYLSELSKFVSKTHEMMKEKKSKRAALLKRLLKYKKKINAIENAISNLDRMVKFGERVPSLLEDL